jgi:hypothetical protein
MTTATQEPLAEQLRAPARAPMTVRDRSPGPIRQDGCLARTHRRARRQQIIGWRWGVNRDASLFRRAPGSGLVARHAAAVPTGRPGSAARRFAATAAGPAAHTLRHSKSGRGRSSCRSPSGCDSPRRGTASPMQPRHGMAEHQVDLRHGCRDIGPACVPGTVWGTASSLTAKFRSRRRAYPSREVNLTRHLPPDQRAVSRMVARTARTNGSASWYA